MTRTWGDYILVEAKDVPSAVTIIAENMTRTVQDLPLEPTKRYYMEWTVKEQE